MAGTAGQVARSNWLLWPTPQASIYKGDDPKQRQSKEIIRKINDTYFLVNIVDNDYQSSDSDIFAIFKTLVVQNMSKLQLQSYADSLSGKVHKLRKKLLSSEKRRIECAKGLQRSGEECAALLSENRKLKAQAQYKVAMRARSLSNS